jgi:hypothetical protein
VAALAAAVSAASALATPPPPSSSPPPDTHQAQGVVSAGAEDRPALLWQSGAGVAAAAVSVPASIALGSWAGTLTNSLPLAGLGGLLIATLLPPSAVTFAAWLAGNLGGPERFRWSPALWVAAGVSVASFVAAGLLGLNANEGGSVAVYTAVQAVLLPAAAVGAMQLTAAPPQPLAPSASLLFQPEDRWRKPTPVGRVVWFLF